MFWTVSFPRKKSNNLQIPRSILYAGIDKGNLFHIVVGKLKTLSVCHIPFPLDEINMITKRGRHERIHLESNNSLDQVEATASLHDETNMTDVSSLQIKEISQTSRSYRIISVIRCLVLISDLCL